MIDFGRLWQRPAALPVRSAHGPSNRLASGGQGHPRLDPSQVQRIREETREQLRQVLDELSADFPKVVEVAAVAVGSAVGFVPSAAALYYSGAVVGFSASGLTSGLAAVGNWIGGGMLAGVGVLAVPVTAGGAVALVIVRRRRDARLAAALGTAITKLYAIQERLMENAEYFRRELAEISAYIEQFKRQMP